MRYLMDSLDEAETALRMEHCLDGEGDFVRGERLNNSPLVILSGSIPRYLRHDLYLILF